MSVLAACLLSSIARANDLNVPSVPYPTIQDALDAAASGDRVLIAAGSFTGPRNRDLDPLGKDVHVLGVGAGATVIDVQGTFWDEHGGFWIGAGGPGLVIEGLTITTGYRDKGAALHIAGAAAPTIVDCVFAANATYDRGGAVYVGDAAAPSFSGCVFDSNYSNGGGAVRIDGAVGASFIGCTFTSNQGIYDGGAVRVDAGSATFDACAFTGNNAVSYGGAVALFLGGRATFTSTTFAQNFTHSLDGGAIYAQDAGSLATLTSCSLSANASANHGGAIALAQGAHLIATACTLDSNAAAADGGAIDATAASLTMSGGALYSNSAGNCGGGVLAAQGANAHFEDVSMVTNSAGVDGGAVQAWSATTAVTLTRCEVTHNQAVERGGGIAAAEVQGFPIADGHVFENTAANGGAIAFTNGAWGTILDSVIEANHALAWGGAMLVETGAFVTAERTDFLTNDATQAAGGLAFVGGDGALRWCRIESNLAAAGGGGLRASGDAFVRVHDCQVRGNIAAAGAGLFAEDTARLVLGVATVIDNQASASGGGVEYTTPNLILANTIVWGNAPDGLHDGGGGTAIVAYCDVQGGFAGGAGNIASDPLLAFRPSGYFAPGVGSPCIDAGDNSRIPALIAVDALGRPRTLDDPWTPDTGAGTAPIVDIGAVEFAHDPVPYCVAKLNSQGCVPAIAGDGLAFGFPGSCSAQTFVISASNVINNTDGIFFFGLSGRVAIPWQGGTLCVRHPVRRTPVTDSGGNPPPDDCSGVFAFEFNSWACDDALLAPGTVVDAQWWGRDPAHPGPYKTQISGALEFVLN